MIQNFLYALIGTIIVSLLSLVGAFTIILNRHLLERIVMVLVSFASGALIGSAFLHLIPEALEEGGPVFPMIIAGILVFFIIETYLHWYHCHAGHIHRHGHGHKCKIKPMGYLNLFGDAIHNFVDGMIVASAFMVSIPLGIVTNLAIIFHEIPQELGDFGVLLYSGFSRPRALLYNFLSASTVILGVIVTYVFAETVNNVTPFLIPFAAGGFLYIAMTDLMAELKEEGDLGKATLQIMLFVAGIGLAWALRYWFAY